MILINPPSSFNGTDGSPSSFGSGCTRNVGLIQCTDNTNNPLFNCGASNNNYYGWDSDMVAILLTFASHYQSMNILVIFLISYVSAPISLYYAALVNNQDLPADPEISLLTNLPEGPYQHSYALSPAMMFDKLFIAIYI